jgi:hypothetical protein
MSDEAFVLRKRQLVRYSTGGAPNPRSVSVKLRRRKATHVEVACDSPATTFTGSLRLPDRLSLHVNTCMTYCLTFSILACKAGPQP